MRVGIEFFPSALHRPWEADTYWWQVIQGLISLFPPTDMICLTNQHVHALSSVLIHRQISSFMQRYGTLWMRVWWEKQQPDCIFSIHKPAHAGKHIPCCVLMSPDDGYRDQQNNFNPQQLQRLWDRLHTRKHLIIFPFSQESKWTSALHAVYLYPVPEVAFCPCSWEDEQRHRMQFADGHPYFLTAAIPVHDRKNVIVWLKAFSVLKKRLQSSVRWLWLLKPEQFALAERILQGYAFRSDIILLDALDISMLAAALSSAYAYLAVGPVRTQWRMALASVYSGVPVMGIMHPAYEALVASAGMWIAQEDVEIIAAHWLRLYQDEYLRKKMVETCYQQRKYTYDDFLHTLQSYVQSLQADAHTVNS